MHIHNSAAGKQIRHVWLAIENHSRIALTFMLVLTITAAGAIGFSWGHFTPVAAAPAASDAAMIAAFDEQISAANEQSTVIEQINLEQQLAAEQKQFVELESSLEEKQDEMAGVMDNVNATLLANLNSKSISRSSKTAAAYRQEAINLIALKRKLTTFLKTNEAKDVDLSEYKSTLEGRLNHIPTIKPIPGRYGGYGYRIHPIFGNYQFHPACDIGAATGTPIKAAADGYVTYSGWGNGSGNYVRIRHGNGYETTYMHCSKLLVRSGQTVHKGDIIGLVGSTGSSTAPHLHYEIKFNGSSINPATMLLE